MPPAAGAPPRRRIAEQIWLNTSFGRVEAWYLPAIEPAGGPSPLLLFYARQRRIDRLLAGGV